MLLDNDSSSHGMSHPETRVYLEANRNMDDNTAEVLIYYI